MLSAVVPQPRFSPSSSMKLRTSWRWGQVYAFRDGRVSAVDNYFEVRDALEAAGLRE
jgi:hypothetical protein